MAPYNGRGGYATGNRTRGFVANRSGFNNNYYYNNNNRGFVNKNFYVKRTRGSLNNIGTRNFSDARELLQQKSSRFRFGGSVTDLSQKLFSRTQNGVGFSQRGGGASRMGTRLHQMGQLNRKFGYNVNLQNRFSNNRFGMNRSGFAVDNAARNKFIKVHRGGITVTTKQNHFQKRQNVQLKDELEEMTLDDLPQLESMVVPQPVSQSLESRLQHSKMNKSGSDSATVLVSNLKHAVTEEDIHELFGAVGQMTSAQLLHPGTALVTYVDQQSAQMAVEYYNNITLDGMVMHCTILSLDKQTGRPSISSRLGERASSASPSFLPAVPTSHAPRFGMQNAGRQVQTMPRFATRTPYRPKFTVCLN